MKETLVEVHYSMMAILISRRSKLSQTQRHTQSCLKDV